MKSYAERRDAFIDKGMIKIGEVSEGDLRKSLAMIFNVLMVEEHELHRVRVAARIMCALTPVMAIINIVCYATSGQRLIDLIVGTLWSVAWLLQQLLILRYRAPQIPDQVNRA